MASIYVSLPSIRDGELTKTISRCLEKTSKHNQITIGVAGIFFPYEKDEILELIDLCKKISNVKLKIIDRDFCLGIGLARKEAMSMYDGEDYILQIDAHMVFMQNWDEYCITKFKKIKDISPENKVILTGYPSEYKYTEFNKIELLNGWDNHAISEFTDKSLIDITPHGESCIYCSQWSPLPLWVEKKSKDLGGDFIKNNKISANYIFADSTVAHNYSSLFPFNYGFFDEELVMSIEAHALGYYFYAIQEGLPVAHLYAEDENEFSGSRSGLEESDLLELNVKQNYLNYVLDPNNKEKIEKFEKYANVKIIKLAESESRKVENRNDILSQRLDKRESS